MPVKMPAKLPAARTLDAEHIFFMTEERARAQDVRPLKIGIVNLMPTKIETETQILRMLSNTPLQIEIVLIHMSSHVSKNTSQEHLDTFYQTFDDIKNSVLDGLIITGAPVEMLEFREVDYWPELCAVMEWSKTHVYNTMHICWGAQAGLFYHYGVDKFVLPEKLSGVYRHNVLIPKSRLTRGFDSPFYAPHSSYTGIRERDVVAAGLTPISTSPHAGLYIAASKDRRQVFITGHAEYDISTLDTEYRRDVKKGLEIKPPINYYMGDDPKNPPEMRWRAHAHLLFANWLNYYVYQETPYDLARLGGQA
ncbi:MAG: homoserine O-succinyltransferase [Defluviitaleaceae bacterium]|nr:homoserine O-succinyltransferase [Defluviitaleaceae bacterium]